MNAQPPERANFVTMNNDVIPYLQHLPELSQMDFLRKLEAQLAKDLYPADWGPVSTEPTPTEVVNRLQQVVAQLIEEHSSSLGQVLYRIDIQEGKIRSLISATAAAERVSVLSGEILEREAKKVWLRMHFSQNS